ncbi:hypothetical protein CYL18_14385 [Pradoshia eiseniae]|uniref:Uncharacterized protein n=1 Tax=Pradoshia eiseniae TaxID=2064768 RepID=A0A2S7MXA6_9BACI|nr:hypothetical protein CYL18_14385 [Pradoshia eiseniae]
MKKIACPYCRDFFEYSHNVILDINYTISHEICFTELNFEIKDKGSFLNIIEKYNVFHEILPKA